MTTSKTILLVEDHAESARSLARILTKQGHAVSVAGTLRQARSLLAERPFDVAVCDLGLPDGDGCELMRELAGQYGLKGIALTGFGSPDDLERIKNAGFAAHLLKPITVESLMTALEEVGASAGDPETLPPSNTSFLH